MTYLKDIKVCVDCTFYGTPHGQRDRCLHPTMTKIDLVTGKEEYPYCYAQRQIDHKDYCGHQGRFFALNEEAALRRKEFEEACRDAPF